MNRKIINLLFCIFTFFLFSLNCYANDYDITKYDVEIVVDEHNKYGIKENIDTYFNVSKHGIIRRIPLYNNIIRQDGTRERNRVLISNVHVNEEFASSRENNNYVLKIGSADKTINGKHSYTISYDYDIGLDKNNKYDELYFNIIGTNWDTDISNVTFKITMPKEFDASKLGFSYGEYGESNTDNISYDVDGNVITGSFEGTLLAGEGLNVRMLLPEGYFIRKSVGSSLLECWYYIIPILGVLISYLIWKKYGKDDQVVDVVSFYPPENMNSLDVAFAKKGSVNSNDAVSLLVYLASKGYIKIVEDKKSKSRFTIQKVKEYDGNNKEEELFFRGLFKKVWDSISSDELNESFYLTINSILTKKNSTANRKEIFNNKSSNKRYILFLFMLITSSLSTIIPALGYKLSDVIFSIIICNLIGIVALIIVGIIYDNNCTKKGLNSALGFAFFFVLALAVANFTIIGFEYIYYDTVYLIGFILCMVCTYLIYFFYLIVTKRTEYGNKVLGEVNGFKKFLETAEKDKLESLVHDDPSYFYNILPYAYVLGVSDAWIKQFEGIAIAPPDWYESADTFDYYRFNRSLNRTIHSASRVMNSVPQSSGGSSSGGGFSGGGFSGGGSGGGGGSSW